MKTNSLKAWIVAIRPYSLGNAVILILVGSALAWTDGSFHTLPVVLCLAFALLMQCTANLVNDLWDFLKGADQPDRLGPDRAFAKGFITLRAMKAGIIGFTLASAAAGIGILAWALHHDMLAWGGWELVAVGAACVLFAYFYTAGPWPLAYHGLGDVAVILFFGLVPVSFTYYVLTGTWTWELAGDALLTYAFETATKALDIEPQNPGIGKAIRILSAKAGIYGMVGGQTVDVESENTCDMTKEKLDFIYRLKTSALIEASMMIGAVLAGATGNEQKIVEEVASKVGLAFQIQDDILDVTSTMEVLGKPIGSDEKNHKSTYVTYEGIEKAGRDVADLSEQAIAQMKALVVKNEFLTELLRYLISREK